MNLAARLEGLTKDYGSGILVSETFLRRLAQPERYHSRFVDRVRVKGKQEPVSVFEIIDAAPANDIDRNLTTDQDPIFGQ